MISEDSFHKICNNNGTYQHGNVKRVGNKQYLLSPVRHTQAHMGHGRLKNQKSDISYNDQ